MNKELKFDHFKNINELLEHIDIWYKEDDIDYTRWFGLNDLKQLKDYITNIQQENKQLKEKIKYVDEFCDRYMGVRLELFDMYELLNKIREILGDKE